MAFPEGTGAPFHLLFFGGGQRVHNCWEIWVPSLFKPRKVLPLSKNPRQPRGMVRASFPQFPPSPPLAPSCIHFVFCLCLLLDAMCRTPMHVPMLKTQKNTTGKNFKQKNKEQGDKEKGAWNKTYRREHMEERRRNEQETWEKEQATKRTDDGKGDT